MSLLLDSHTFLWYISGDSQLSQVCFELIEDVENEVFVSMASLWEIAIKVSLGKLSLHGSHTLKQLVKEKVLGNDFEILDITTDHLELIRTLELHHRDPFDRLIIAQALSENLTVLTKDGSFSNYSVTTLW